MSNITLYFGSFNPIHIGHLSLAEETLKLTDTDELWFVVSPRSPFKMDETLIEANHRVEMVNIAIAKNNNMKVCDIELTLNPGFYTIDTLRILNAKYPQHSFSILMGEDNLRDFDKWKEPELILANHKIFVYPRESLEKNIILKNRNIKIFKANYINISSTEIRRSIREGVPLVNLLPKGVFEYIARNKLI